MERTDPVDVILDEIQYMPRKLLYAIVESMINVIGFHIYIWRYSKDGHIKKKECCNVCTKYLRKSNYYNRIYTFDNSDIVTAISDNPEISLNYKIKYGLN